LGRPDLPEPACRAGYTLAQLLLTLGASERLAALHKWVAGQTVECDDPSQCGPHGTVVPRAALARFLALERAKRR
jgi:hypothetical protein